MSSLHRHNHFEEVFDMSWLNPRYFAVATAITAILQGVKVVNGQVEPISALITALIGGLFWGVIFTSIARLFKK